MYTLLRSFAVLLTAFIVCSILFKKSLKETALETIRSLRDSLRFTGAIRREWFAALSVMLGAVGEDLTGGQNSAVQNMYVQIP